MGLSSGDRAQLIPQALDPNALYIGPALTPGQFGNQVFLYGPWLQKYHPNFFLVPNRAANISVNTLFGQTRNAYHDINSTNHPGSPLLEFQLRHSF